LSSKLVLPKFPVKATPQSYERWGKKVAEILQERIKKIESEIPETPKHCHICGAPLECHAIGGGKETWYCSAAKYIGGSPEEQEHFRRSMVEAWTYPFQRGQLLELKQILEAVSSH
jgi:hypothetical protein